MIDKLDLRIPRKASFTSTFARLYPELRAMEKSPFRPAKYYEYAGDLREFDFNLRLNLYCQMDKVGNHKIELIDVGEMNRGDICREVQQVFDIDPRTLGLMRVDFAVDIPKIPVSWFREAVRIEHKRFRAAVTGDKFYSEMGHGDIQTLYFGKRPNVIRIYDKGAEFRHRHQMRLRRWDSKEANVYYRCTGHRGKCDLPRFREEDIAARLGEPLRGLQVPPEVVTQIIETLRKDQTFTAGRLSAERSRLEARLTNIRSRMDAAYMDKLDGKIPAEFWERKMMDWRMEEQQVKMAIQGFESAEFSDRALDAQRILELANNAYSSYLSQDSTEKAKLLRILFRTAL